MLTGESAAFRQDFDGIVSRAPAYSFTELTMAFLNNMKRMQGTPGGAISAAKANTIDGLRIDWPDGFGLMRVSTAAYDTHVSVNPCTSMPSLMPSVRPTARSFCRRALLAMRAPRDVLSPPPLSGLRSFSGVLAIATGGRDTTTASARARRDRRESVVVIARPP